MEPERLYQKLPVLNTFSKRRRKEFERYFSTAPEWVLDEINVVNIEAHTIFIEENTPVNTIYIVGKGTAAATEFRIFDVKYDFSEFEDVIALGAMEMILDIPNYKTTLSTITPCTFLVIPGTIFKRWLDTDIQLLKHESRAMCNNLLRQGRQERAFIFLDGADRLALFFIQQYRRKKSRSDTLYLTITRKELAWRIGMSIKTVNRAVGKLVDEQLIGKQGHKLVVSREQYERLEEKMADVLDE